MMGKEILRICTESFVKYYLGKDYSVSVKEKPNSFATYGTNILFLIKNDYDRKWIIDRYRWWLQKDKWISKLPFKIESIDDENGYLNVRFEDQIILFELLHPSNGLYFEMLEFWQTSKYNPFETYFIKTKKCDAYLLFGGEKGWAGMSREEVREMGAEELPEGM